MYYWIEIIHMCMFSPALGLFECNLNQNWVGMTGNITFSQHQKMSKKLNYFFRDFLFKKIAQKLQGS